MEGNFIELKRTTSDGTYKGIIINTNEILCITPSEYKENVYIISIGHKGIEVYISDKEYNAINNYITNYSCKID